MGGAVILFQIVFLGPPLLFFVCILTAARKGYPRTMGRRAYVIAIAPQLLVGAAILLYFRFGETWFGPDTFNNSIIPVSFLVIGVFILIAGVLACLLALLLYRPAGCRNP